MARYSTWVHSIIALVALGLGGCGATQYDTETGQSADGPAAQSTEVQALRPNADLLEPWTVPQQVATAPAAAPAPSETTPLAPAAPAEAAPQRVAESAAPSQDTQAVPQEVPATASADSDDSMLLVRRLVVARGIEDREPVDAAVMFDNANEPLFAFLELANQQPESQNVVVSFEREDGTKVRSISLEVPAQVSRWRTWARCYGIDQQGNWSVVARTPDGQLLAQGAFSVASAAVAEQEPAAPAAANPTAP